jgi:hypothetical protein
MSSSLEGKSTIRNNPKVTELFRQAEGRHFSEEELATLVNLCPTLTDRAAAAKEVKECDVAVIQRVVKEVFSQYDYEQHHEFAQSKCPRDVRYVVCYAVQAMLCEDPGWFDNKVLVWLKTILQAFDFPVRSKGVGGALFADKELELKLQSLPQKSKSIFHCYYKLKKEMEKELSPQAFSLMEPYFQQSIDSLTEPY